MPKKFFLALDYETDDAAIEKGLTAIDFLRSEFGRDFVEQRVGVKINQDLLTGTIDPRHRQFPDNGNEIFVDLKISHGADTGERIIKRILDKEQLPIRYFTVASDLRSTILSQYVAYAQQRGLYVVAFTAHTKIPEQEVRRMSEGQSLDDIIFNRSQVAYEAGCHAVVLEAERLMDPRTRDLKLRKLVTGIRVDPSDKGTQSRVTSLDTLSALKQHVDYVVVSSRYISKPESLHDYFVALL